MVVIRMKSRVVSANLDITLIIQYQLKRLWAVRHIWNAFATSMVQKLVSLDVVQRDRQLANTQLTHILSQGQMADILPRFSSLLTTSGTQIRHQGDFC